MLSTLKNYRLHQPVTRVGFFKQYLYIVPTEGFLKSKVVVFVPQQTPQRRQQAKKREGAGPQVAGRRHNRQVSTQGFSLSGNWLGLTLSMNTT